MRNIRIISFAFAILAFLSAGASAQQVLSAADKRIIADFEKRANAYYQFRERIEGRLKKLPDNATPEQIQIYKTSFQQSVQMARRRAKQGELFTPAATSLIRRIIKTEFVGWKRSELRKSVLEADTKAVPLKINVPYPESQELVEMPPQLLLVLPQMPRALRFRFVSRNLVILDRENALIIDFMRNALP